MGIQYLTTFYCPTMPSSDIDPPFGSGIGHPESQDPGEYQVPPCFFGDTGTGSVLPPDLHYGAFAGVKTFYGLAPWFPGPAGASGAPAAAVSATPRRATSTRSHLLTEASSPPASWNIRGVEIHDRSIRPDRTDNCRRAGPTALPRWRPCGRPS